MLANGLSDSLRVWFEPRVFAVSGHGGSIGAIYGSLKSKMAAPFSGKLYSCCTLPYAGLGFVVHGGQNILQQHQLFQQQQDPLNVCHPSSVLRQLSLILQPSVS